MQITHQAAEIRRKDDEIAYLRQQVKHQQNTIEELRKQIMIMGQESLDPLTRPRLQSSFAVSSPVVPTSLPATTPGPPCLLFRVFLL